MGINGILYGKNKEIIFEQEQNIVQLGLHNVSRNQSIQIELFEPSNGYHLGENKVADISFVCKFHFAFVNTNQERDIIHYGYISACCTKIDVTLFGDAFKYEGSMSGIYHMHAGFSNGQRYWMSSEGNAIWYTNIGDWSIGYSIDLGTTIVSLYVPIKDPSRECPHDDLRSNWWYAKGNKFVEDVNNSVFVQCVPTA